MANHIPDSLRLPQLPWAVASFWHRIVVLLTFIVVACNAIIPDDLVVQTTKGKIRGVTLKSATNK